MPIVHLIGGVILIAPFLLRMPQASSTLSLFLTAFKTMAPVSFPERIDVFSSLSAFIASPPFHSDVAPSPDLPFTDLVVYYPPSQFSNSGSAVSVNVPTEVVVQEVGQEKSLSSLDRIKEKPGSTPTSYTNMFLLLVPPCAILTLYLACVSRQG